MKFSGALRLIRSSFGFTEASQISAARLHLSAAGRNVAKPALKERAEHRQNGRQCPFWFTGCRNIYTSPRRYASEDDSNDHHAPIIAVLASDHKTATHNVVPGKGPPPEAPVSCCMSGCANCVYLKYADELFQYYQDGGQEAMDAIEKEVTDENLKAYLKLELKGMMKK